MKVSFKVILFTKSCVYQKYAQSKQIEILDDYEENKYHLPILLSMFNAVRRRYSYDYIGYLNSDILIHPGIFGVLKVTTEAVANHTFPPKLVLASRVTRANIRKSAGNICSHREHCNRFFSNLQKNSKMRTPTSAVNLKSLNWWIGRLYF